MRISDWSSDVCSSDLWERRPLRPRARTQLPTCHSMPLPFCGASSLASMGACRRCALSEVRLVVVTAFHSESPPATLLGSRPIMQPAPRLRKLRAPLRHTYDWKGVH